MLKVRRCSHHGGHLYLGPWHCAWVWQRGWGLTLGRIWYLKLGWVMLTNSQG
jgi:hypothetical protein